MNQAQTNRLVTRLSHSPSAREVDYSKTVERQLSELRSKCEKMCTMIDLLQLMTNTEMPVRCLVHNNALTLYCLTERKALCVNCTYGDMRHRTHRVLPLKDAMSHVEKDNQDFTALLQDKMAELEETIKIANKNGDILRQSLVVDLKRMEESHVR